ncbi:MAG: sensor domain-containing diguanylate cyclase [Deltaproteobacteria bacterium]|nr:sensor domain-containing diguanylate cyclase [Deltaproteobacteria bacterium]MBW2071319.1 sensor domain-containing diguanylate cyclase [Deltaproteobacteria bacterium]
MTCLEICKALTSTFNMDQILFIIIKRLSELLRADNWTLFLLDSKKKELYFEVVVGLDKETLEDVRIKVGEGIAGTVARTGEPVLVPDVRLDDRFCNRVDNLTGFVTRSLICLPLKMQGSIIGVLEVVNPEDQTLFQPEFMPVLAILADYVAIAINNARNYKQIELLSITDDVTGYYNSRFLHQHLDWLLQSSKARTKQVSLVFLDIDNFKEVVDTHGHLLGSRVLKEVAKVIASKLDHEDKLVRYGGDEYVIVLPDQDKKAALDKVVAIRKSLAEMVFLQDKGLKIHLTASFGVANYPDDACDQRELLHIADNSMYRSKELGKNSITLA